jgi:hypothetical protein
MEADATLTGGFPESTLYDENGPETDSTELSPKRTIEGMLRVILILIVQTYQY